tara:strand:+ start:16707 stop:18161 length:1455 start_codon:yes stop_codon:yes gene_type:complete
LKSSYKSTAKDTIINGIADFLLIPLTFIKLPLLTKNLSASEYGIWGLMHTTAGLALPLTTLGLGVAMSRFLPYEKDKNKLSEGFYSVFFIRIALCLLIISLLLIFKQYIALKFFDNNIKVVELMTLFILLSIIQPIYMRMVTIFRLIKARSILRIIDSYIPIAVIAILFYFDYGLISIIKSTIVIKALITLYLFIYTFPRIGIKIPKFTPVGEYLSYGLPTLPASLGFWLVNLSDRFLVTFFLGTSAVGVYTASYQIGSLPYMFAALINFVLMVALSKLYDEGKIEEVKTHLSYAMKYFLTLAIPFIFGSLVLAKEILILLSTKEIALAGETITPMIAIGFLFLGIYNIMRYVLLITKKTKMLPFIWLISVPINLILNLIFIPKVGIIGAALSTILSYLIPMILITYLAFREFTFNINLIFIFKSIVASITMAFSLNSIIKYTEINIFILISSGIIVYFLTLFLLRGITRAEIIFFKNIVLKRA